MLFTNNDTVNGITLPKVNVNKIFESIPYLLAIVGSILIAFSPPLNLTLANNSVLLTFSSLSTVLIVKILFSLFLMSFFPGYILCRRFFNSFSGVEKAGLTLALSYCFNAILGLLLSSLNVLSPVSYLISTWLFVIIILITNISKNLVHTAQVSSQYILRWETILVLLTSITLLIGSYGMAVSIGPISGLFGGDPPRYMVYTNQYFQLNIASYIPWLSFYMLIGTVLTGLPLIYVYSIIQYLVLLSTILRLLLH